MYDLPSSVIGISKAMTENAQGQINLLCYNQKANSEEAVLVQLKTNVSGIGIEEELANLKGLKLYPNPTSEKLIVNFNSKKESDYSLVLLNISGQIISEKIIQTQAGENIIDISDIVSNAQTGLCLLQLSSVNQTLKTIKVMVK